MANTYTQLHVQLVFAVKYRSALIEKEWKERLHQYTTGIIQRKEGKENPHKLLQINSMPDHIHILIGMRPHQSISALAQNVKTESTIWINDNKLCKIPFAWQLGFYDLVGVLVNLKIIQRVLHQQHEYSYFP